MDVARFVEVLEGIVAKAHDCHTVVSEIRRQQIEIMQWVSTATPVDPQVENFLTTLSRRELEVLANVSRGHTNSEVAAGLGISAHTIKRHLDNIYRRGVLVKRSDVIEAAKPIQQLYLASSGHS
jgi:ATP/maltotriose-dependent transcriptional regulator MalT